MVEFTLRGAPTWGQQPCPTFRDRESARHGFYPWRESIPCSQSQAVRTAAGRRTTAYDGLGRVRTVTAPDGSVTETRYTGPLTLALDASAQHKTRQSTSDALGRLTQVVENQTTWNGQAVGVAAEPVLTTTYSYDALDDLLSVAQGTQSRTFVYDSLKRLVQGIRQSNPTLYAERD